MFDRMVVLSRRAMILWPLAGLLRENNRWPSKRSKDETDGLVASRHLPFSAIVLVQFLDAIRPRNWRNKAMIESLKQLLAHLYDVKGLIEWGGPVLVCAIVFIETGMFVGFFLPGDSLLVTAGVFAGAGHTSIAALLIFVTLCAIAGDQLGYWIGRMAGQSLYKREDSHFFKKRHLERAHEFYEKYGGKTVILARFVPIIRTFCPPVAGAAKMSYSRYLLYDVFGGFLWVWSMTLLGYTLGRSVPNIDKRIHIVIAAVVVASLLPAAYSAWKARSQTQAIPPTQAKAEEE
jgi:membrane-associated protein